MYDTRYMNLHLSGRPKIELNDIQLDFWHPVPKLYNLLENDIKELFGNIFNRKMNFLCRSGNNRENSIEKCIIGLLMVIFLHLIVIYFIS